MRNCWRNLRSVYNDVSLLLSRFELSAYRFTIVKHRHKFPVRFVNHAMRGFVEKLGGFTQADDSRWIDINRLIIRCQEFDEIERKPLVRHRRIDVLSGTNRRAPIQQRQPQRNCNLPPHRSPTPPAPIAQWLLLLGLALDLFVGSAAPSAAKAAVVAATRRP